jgi:HK97 family phage portal protein
MAQRSSVHPARLDDPGRMFYGTSGDDATGLELSESEVLGWPALIQALRMISWSIGMLPCPIYEITGNGKGKLRTADEHPLHWVLHDEPHPEYTPFEFKSCMAFRAAFQGDAYGQILWRKDGAVEKVFPMETHRMTTRRVNGQLVFEYNEGGRVKVFPSEEILHVKGFNDGGILGFAMNQISRTTLAKGVAMDRFGARVFRNGMTSGAVIEAEQPFKFNSDEEKKRFYDKIQESMSGQDNWHRVIGLPYGMKMKNLGVSPKDAQLIEGLTFQVQDIARLTGVPPSLLMELSRSTFTNSEQQMLQFVQLCLGPWITNIEQRFQKSLLTKMDRKKYAIKFLVDALLRTDLKTQNDALRVAVGQPWMSVNEARDLKELQPLEGEQYNEVALPLNMANPGGDPSLTPEPSPVGGAATPAQDGDADTGQRGAPEYRNAGKAGFVARSRYYERRAGNKPRLALRAAYRRTITRDAGRMVKAEIREIRKMLDKSGLQSRGSAEDFSQALQNWFEGAGFSATAGRTLVPTLRDFAVSMADAAAAQAGGGGVDVSKFIDEYLGNFERGTAGSHLGQLLKLIRETDPDGLTAAIEGRLDEWENGREDGERMGQAEKIGLRESVQLGEAVARAAWSSAGVSTLVWLASSDACPICDEIDGRVVGIEDSFVEASGQVDGGDDQPVLRPTRDIKYPPIHGGCACDIAPG